MPTHTNTVYFVIYRNKHAYPHIQTQPILSYIEIKHTYPHIQTQSVLSYIEVNIHTHTYKHSLFCHIQRYFNIVQTRIGFYKISDIITPEKSNIRTAIQNESRNSNSQLSALQRNSIIYCKPESFFPLNVEPFILTTNPYLPSFSLAPPYRLHLGLFYSQDDGNTNATLHVPEHHP